MGVADAIRGGAVYLDTSVFIYAVEGYAPYARALAELFEAVDMGHLRAVTSELTLGEALVKPMADGNLALQHAYQEAVQSSASLAVVPITRQVLVEAAGIRARARSIKMPDAIHIATARLEQCGTVLTNDKLLKAAEGIHVLLCSEA